MKRNGVVLVFRSGTPKGLIEEALNTLQMRRVLDQTQFIAENGEPVGYRIEEFDDQFGGPVWYVP